jgi:hypothetical protein
MLDSIVTSKTRIKMLLRFFLDPDRSSYLRELSKDLGESSNAVRVELNHLSEAHLIECVSEGRTKCYRANREHPLFADLRNIVRKTLGIDKLLEHIVARLGDVKVGLVTGDYARGIDSGIIDLVLVGNIDRSYLDELIGKAERYLKNRKIRCLCLTEEEFARFHERLKQEKGILEIYRSDGQSVVSTTKENSLGS